VTRRGVDEIPCGGDRGGDVGPVRRLRFGVGRGAYQGDGLQARILRGGFVGAERGEAVAAQQQALDAGRNAVGAVAG
jgi:hypothetical protein